MGCRNIVQRIMGHEDVTTTLGIYTDVPEDYVDRVDDLLLTRRCLGG